MKMHKSHFLQLFFALLLTGPLLLVQINSNDSAHTDMQVLAMGDVENNSNNNTSNNSTSETTDFGDTPMENTSNGDTFPTDTNASTETQTDHEFYETPSDSTSGGSLHTPSVPTTKPVKKTIKKIYFSKTFIKLWPQQSTYNAPTIKDNGAKYQKITWNVDNEKYAKITSNGTVTLKKKGAGKKVTVTATVYYKQNGTTCTKSASYTIEGQRPVRSLKFQHSKNYVFIGKRLALKVSCLPQTASCQKILWSSSNKAYATISQKGIIHPKKAGTGKTVTFTAATTDGSMIVKTIKIRIINPRKPMVALTFDDGPSPAYTTKIVNELERFDAHATFFVLGSRLTGESSKSIISKAAKNGNEIASHTYNHKKLTALPISNIKQEASRTEQLIAQITGSAPSLTRPPYGSVNEKVKQNISTPLILWSIDTRDWETRNKSKTVSAVLNHVKDGDIILMHDIYEPTANAAKELIPKLISKGYQLVTVSELATYKNVNLSSGNSYTCITKTKK